MRDLENIWQLWKLLPQEIQDSLKKAFDEPSPEEELIKCPVCKSAHTRDCDEVDGIQDRTIALCMDCGHLFCSACKRELLQNLNCRHWEVCETCIEADENLSCEVGPVKCRKLKGELDATAPGKD